MAAAVLALAGRLLRRHLSLAGRHCVAERGQDFLIFPVRAQIADVTC
jgi:hypothetical protein